MSWPLALVISVALLCVTGLVIATAIFVGVRMTVENEERTALREAQERAERRRGPGRTTL